MRQQTALKMDRTLGQMLLEKGIVTREELDRALRLKAERKGKYLGEILQEIGVPQEKVVKALDHLNKRRRIGEVLLDLEVVTPEQLERALAHQKRGRIHQGIHRPLGILLVELGYARYGDYLIALSKHFSLPIVALNDYLILPHLQRMVGERFALEHKVLVLSSTESSVRVALAEPTRHLMEEIRKALPASKKVVFCLVHPERIEFQLRKIMDPFAVNQFR